jgi:hypothetical protein
MIEASINTKEKLKELSNTIQELGLLISSCVNRRGTVFFIGNGGSAADAQHISALTLHLKTVTKNIKNTGINVPTDTDQKQDCQAAGGSSGISGSCQATSTDRINQTGGQLTR